MRPFSRHGLFLASLIALAALLRITVRQDWGGDVAKALFLRDAHAGACRFFEGVLGPDYSGLHANHFHLEVGGWGFCR